MQDIEDATLLRQYAQTSSEEAFSRLVSRHVNLVYSAALRQVSNPSHAEEITQAVFTILARKAASLGPRVVLPGWLYQTTRLTAANLVRSEIRRARREQEAYMQSLVNENQSDAWTQIAPLLETAMGDLNQKERDAIVLRFFQGRTLQEVGRAFGGSENAAKQRVHRALEKLRAFFAKRKIVLTTAIIAGSVSANSVQAAPAGLAATVAAAAAHGAASGSTLTLIKGALKIMAWTKLKTTLVVGAAVLFAAGTATVTVREISHYKEDAVWRHITRIDSGQLDGLPPLISIRPANFAPWVGNGWVSTGKKEMGSAASLSAMLAHAYGVSETRIVDAGRLPAGKYDYLITLPRNHEKALQGAIKKKFGLVGKKEMVETNVLFFTVARKDASGLKPAQPQPYSGSSSTSGNGELSFSNCPVSNLAGSLEGYLHTPVIDQTGLTDRYDYRLKWREDSGQRNLEEINKALLDDLGLKLTSGTQSINMLVIEKVK